MELLFEPLRWCKIISVNYNFHNPLMDGFYQFVKSPLDQKSCEHSSRR